MKRKVSTLFFRDQLSLRLRSARRPGLPDGQHAEPVPFQVMVHCDPGKPGFGEERGKLPAAENAQAVNNGLPPAIAVLQAASASCPDLTRLHGHDSCCLPSTCPAGPPACASGIRFDPAAEPGDEPQQLARGGKAALGQQMQAAPEQARQLIGTRVGKFLRPGKRLSQPAREACPHQLGVRQRAAEQHAVEQGAAAENIRSAIQRGEVHKAQLRRGIIQVDLSAANRITALSGYSVSSIFSPSA